MTARKAAARRKTQAQNETSPQAGTRLLPGLQPLRPYVVLPTGGCDLDDVIREAVIEALMAAHWVQKDAAALLRMSARRIHYQIRRLGIQHPAGLWTHGGDRRRLYQSADVPHETGTTRLLMTAINRKDGAR